MQQTKLPNTVHISGHATFGSSRAILLVFLFFIDCFTLTIRSQNKPIDVQASDEPRSAPGAGQKFLENFAGDWNVEKIFHPRSGGSVITKGECHQMMINDGRFLESEFTFHNGQTNVTGIGLTGFEPASGMFTSVWADSRSTKMSIRQSKEPFNGEEIVLFSVPIANDVREARFSRDVTRMGDNCRKIIHQQYAINPDHTERLVLELIMTKVGQ